MRLLLRHFFIILLFFTTATGLSQIEITPQMTKSVVDSLCLQLNRFYVSKESAQRISYHLKKSVSDGKYRSIKDPHELAGVLTRDVLAVHRDEHFHIEYNPQLHSELSGDIDDVPGMVAEKLKQDKARNFGFKKAEILGGNIGYLEISAFSRLNQYSREAARSAMSMLSNSRALVIDLRYGSGGSVEMMSHLLSYFFPAKTHISDIYIRSENHTHHYYTTPDSLFTAFHSMPVYVLTSYKTFSAAEGFVYALKNHKRAVIIGEATRGGAHTVKYRPLGHGFVCDLPFGKAIDPLTRGNWEGSGIVPDIQIEAGRSLAMATEKIIQEAIAVSGSNLEKNELNWQLNLLKHPCNDSPVDSVLQRNITGSYGAFNISYKDGCLYYQKAGKARFPLLLAENNILRPKGNDSFIVEFIYGSDGTVSGLITRYEDGRTETAKRSLK